MSYFRVFISHAEQTSLGSLEGELDSPAAQGVGTWFLLIELSSQVHSPLGQSGSELKTCSNLHTAGACSSRKSFATVSVLNHMFATGFEVCPLAFCGLSGV